ncbi:MAG: hypothetical protein SVG88_00875 [Halobacteriales archaeon]|nr:hypothetical protein [Halobacteriales archaeon]
MRQWYRLNWGMGKQMRQAGATIRQCPHCQEPTPVFESEYDTDDDPITFTVCLWCDGLIEYRPDVSQPYPPYASQELINELIEQQRRQHLSRNEARIPTHTQSIRHHHAPNTVWGHGPV